MNMTTTPHQKHAFVSHPPKRKQGLFIVGGVAIAAIISIVTIMKQTYMLLDFDFLSSGGISDDKWHQTFF